MVNIVFISTGGTIANAGTGPRDYLSYLSRGQVLAAGEVIARMPEVSDLASVTVEPFGALRSKEIGPGRWWDLARQVARRCADPEVDGVIVAHGTGVLEETAYFLHLTVNTNKPIVVIGAQRPPRTVSSDAPKNYLDAIHWIRAATGESSGVVVVMDQVVHSARDVAKLANHTLGAMESPAAGPLGRVNADGTVTIHRTPRHRHTAASEFAPTPAGGAAPGAFARVDIVHQYAGADATAVEAFVRAGARGLVVVGFPPGTNTPEIDAALAEHGRRGTVIVQASRAIRDPQVLDRPGLEGVVPNADLSPQHARILLALALGAGLGARAIRRVFAEY